MTWRDALFGDAVVTIALPMGKDNVHLCGFVDVAVDGINIESIDCRTAEEKQTCERLGI